jgi:hypothetical protein
MPTTTLRARLEDLAQGFASAALAAVRGASLEDLNGAPPATGDSPRGNGGTGQLKPLIDGALQAMRQQRACEADVAYRLALLAHAARSSRGTFATCARALGVSRQTLQPYALVAEQWSGDELRTLLAERRNSLGEPISISHLVLLAKLPRPACDRIVERVFSEGLTVRQLRRVLRPSRAKARTRRKGR